MKRKFKVLLTRRLHDFALDKLRKKYEITVHSGKIPMPKNRLLDLIKDKDGLICFPYAKKKKIKIGYTPDVLTNATAELTISLMLDLLRRITEGDRLIRKNNWTEIFGAYDYVGRDVSGKTIGILGMGRIGKSVAMKALGLGMNVIYHNRKPMSKKMEISLKSKYVSLNNLFKKSDVLTIHIPYSKETHHLVDSSLLSKMKKTSFLINTSRVKIVNENDLITYLQQNKIQGAGLDVFEKEPINKKNKLTKLENTVLAPHIGSSTDETRYEMTEIAVKNLILGLNDKKLVYSV